MPHHNSTPEHLVPLSILDAIERLDHKRLIRARLAPHPYRQTHDTPAHLTLEVMTALKTKETSSLTDSQKVAYNEILTSIEELQTADLIVIGAPMHNFGISSGLKTWLDQICQAGITFSYTEQGPKKLVENKPTIIVSTRGGIYSTAPYNALDHQETYIKAVLGLIGITDIKYIRAEGVNISPEMKEQAITNAKKDIHSL